MDYEDKQGFGVSSKKMALGEHRQGCVQPAFSVKSGETTWGEQTNSQQLEYGTATLACCEGRIWRVSNVPRPRKMIPSTESP